MFSTSRFLTFVLFRLCLSLFVFFVLLCLFRTYPVCRLHDAPFKTDLPLHMDTFGAGGLCGKSRRPRISREASGQGKLGADGYWPYRLGTSP